MLRLYDYATTFQEVPDEISLVINISNCPNRCDGCHSKYLWEDVGDTLDKTLLQRIIKKYSGLISCVCFMGGCHEKERLLELISVCTDSKLKVCVYSGYKIIDDEILKEIDYYKVGEFIKKLGGLRSSITNQKFYKKINGKFINITSCFQNNKKNEVFF